MTQFELGGLLPHAIFTKIGVTICTQRIVTFFFTVYYQTHPYDTIALFL